MITLMFLSGLVRGNVILLGFMFEYQLCHMRYMAERSQKLLFYWPTCGFMRRTAGTSLFPKGYMSHSGVSFITQYLSITGFPDRSTIKTEIEEKKNNSKLLGIHFCRRSSSTTIESVHC